MILFSPPLILTAMTSSGSDDGSNDDVGGLNQAPGLQNLPNSIDDWKSTPEPGMCGGADDFDDDDFLNDMGLEDELTFAVAGFVMNTDAWKELHQYSPSNRTVYELCQAQIASIDHHKHSSDHGFVLPRMGGSDLYFDPSLSYSNDGQREFLCAHLKHLEEMHDFETKAATYAPPPLRQILIGVAGTGKSYVMKCNRCFYRMLYQEQSAERSMAPTGKSAGGIGGVTLDAGLKFKRNKSTYVKMGLGALLRLKNQYLHTNLCQIDEQGMIGANMWGHFFTRCNDVFNQKCATGNTDITSVGNIEAMVLAGDPLQLPPVFDDQIFTNMIHKSDLKRSGQTVYDLFKEDIYVLDQPVRQSSTSVWAQELQKLRNPTMLHGTSARLDETVEYWNRRALNRLPQLNWENAMTDNVTCVLAATKRKVHQFNSDYLKVRQNIHRFISVDNAPRGHKDGMMKRVNPSLCVSKDSIVKLTININPEYNLYNGSRGTVVDIVYDPDQDDLPEDNGLGYRSSGLQNAMLIVDFKEYSGPALWDGAPATWVAIQRVELCCDNDTRCCKRRGYPLMVGKADTIHCSQGMTIGIGEQFRRVVGWWTGRMEQNIGPGLWYVLASRCKTMEDFALLEKFTKTSIKTIATGRKFGAIKLHDDTLRSLARTQRKARADSFANTQKKSVQQSKKSATVEFGSQQDLVLRMHWFYKTCREKMAGMPSDTAKSREINACLNQWRQSFKKVAKRDFDEFEFVKRTTNVKAPRRRSARATNNK